MNGSIITCFLKDIFLKAFLLAVNPGAELHSHRITVSSALVICFQKFPKVAFARLRLLHSAMYPTSLSVFDTFCFCILAFLVGMLWRPLEIFIFFPLRLMKLNTILCFLLIGNTPFEAPVKVTPHSAFLKICLHNFLCFL